MLYSEAVQFASERHKGQFRKNGITPYIQHPLSVARILHNEAGIEDNETLIAAVLHDTIEDTGVSHAMLAEMFSPDIADIVQELTNDESLPKAAQKQAQIDKAPHMSQRAAFIKVADKTANLRDIIAEPPADWDSDTKLKYYNHAMAVVEAMGHKHDKLIRIFQRTYDDGVAKLLCS